MKNSVLYIYQDKNRFVDENIKTLSTKFKVIEKDINNSDKIKDNFQIIIQHTNPNLWEYFGDKYIHLGVLENRCVNIYTQNWNNRINSIGIDFISTRPVNGKEVIMPIATDISRYNTEKKVARPSHNFTFYTKSTNNRIDNLSAIIKAFHLTFGIWHPVDLVIFADDVYETSRFINDVKSKMKIKVNGNNYKREILLDNHKDFHRMCDVYIGASSASNWDFNAFDAMCFGKTPIVNNCYGYNQFINDKNGYLVDNHLEPVIGSEHDLENSSSEWNAISVRDLSRAMLESFNDKSRDKKSDTGVEDSLYYDYSNVIPEWEKVIQNVNTRREQTRKEKKSKKICFKK